MEALNKELSKEAGFLLNMVNRGSLDLNRLKAFLARVESFNPTPARGQKQRDLIAYYEKRLG